MDTDETYDVEVVGAGEHRNTPADPLLDSLGRGAA
jgi:hypothetical protein